jgi:hypothetical protein
MSEPLWRQMHRAQADANPFDTSSYVAMLHVIVKRLEEEKGDISSAAWLRDEARRAEAGE